MCPGQRLHPGPVTAWPCRRRRGGHGIMVGELLCSLCLPGSPERPPCRGSLAPACFPQDWLCVDQLPWVQAPWLDIYHTRSSLLSSALQTANLIKWAAERLLPLTAVGNLMTVSLSQLEGRGGACPAPRLLSPPQAQPRSHDRLSWSSSPGAPAKMRKSCSPGSELLAQLQTDTSSRTCFKAMAGVTHVFACECAPALPPGLLRSSRRWPWSQE